MFFSVCGQAEIVQIQKIDSILHTVDSVDTLVLFDMDDTLTDSTLSVGSGAWRKFIRQYIADYEAEHETSWGEADLHDLLTLHVAKHVPVKPVEKKLPQVVQQLQNLEIPVFVFTARGKNKWYSTTVPGIDLLTQKQLKQAGFDFSLSAIPEKLKNFDSNFFQNGVIYSSPLKKGVLLKKILTQTGYKPAKIVFIDDKIDQIESMENAAKELQIPFTGFWYTRADLEHKNFDPILAQIQLSMLIYNKTLLPDIQAEVIKKTLNAHAYGAKVWFYRFLESFKLDDLSFN